MGVRYSSGFGRVGLGVAGITSLLAASAHGSVPAVERTPFVGVPAPSPGRLVYTPDTSAFSLQPVPLRGLRLDGDVTFVPHAVLGLIGQPITPDLVRKIERLISRELSTDGHVVTARYEPTPDAAGGVLTFGVARFTVAHLATKGGTAHEVQQVESRLSLAPGQAVDPAALAFDLDSLNRYPFRQVGVKVSPAGASQSDIAIDITDTKPWSASWGYKYSGGPHESWRRAYAGGSVGDLLGQDSVLAFQVTASPNALVRSNTDPDLADANLTYTKPVGDRGSVEAGYELTGMTFKSLPDIYWLDEMDGTADYRYLLTGPATGWGQSDVRLGLDLRHEHVLDHQAGRLTFDMTDDVDELFLGYHINRSRTAQQTDFDISLRLSPALDVPGDTASHYAVYSALRMKSARYGYVSFTIDETVGDNAGPRWHSQVLGTLASGPLPYYDQAIMGGQTFVRGYFLGDGSFDDAVVWRNEFKAAPLSGGLKSLAPFVMADIAVGHDDQLKVTRTLASTGFGVAWSVTPTVTLNADVAHALRHGPDTAAGTNVFEMNLKTTY